MGEDYNSRKEGSISFIESEEMSSMAEHLDKFDQRPTQYPNGWRERLWEVSSYLKVTAISGSLAKSLNIRRMMELTAMSLCQACLV